MKRLPHLADDTYKPITTNYFLECRDCEEFFAGCSIIKKCPACGSSRLDVVENDEIYGELE